MKEEWRDIKDYEGLYKISNLGNVFGVKRNKILKPIEHKRYLNIILSKEGKRKSFRVHRLVAIHFIPNPKNHESVNHKDENKRNNSVLNLEWCTITENNIYGTRLSRVKESLHRRKNQCIGMYDVNGNLIKVFKTKASASKEIGVNLKTMYEHLEGYYKTCRGYVFKWIDMNVDNKLFMYSSTLAHYI